MTNVQPMPADLKVNATLTTRMHDALEAAIITGALTPGQRLHADALAADYGMSRIPVREALRSLHEAGWVEIKPRHGVHVRERTSQELEELFEFRALVEGRVALWAAERRTEDDLAAMTAGAGRSADDSGSGFYAALRAAAHNSVLASTSAALEKRARFYFSTIAHELGEDWRQVHEELLDLVSAQDAAAAQQLAQRHVEETGRAVRALLFKS